MKRLILLLFCILLISTGCFADYDETSTPTPIVTKRVIEDETSTPFVTNTVALLTPKPTTDNETLEFSIVALEQSGGYSYIAINLDGDSVDLVASLTLLSAEVENAAVNFIALSQSEILALENKYMASIYTAYRLHTTADGLYSLKLQVSLADGSTKEITISQNLDF